MLKEKLFKASFAIALSAIVCAAGTAFSQDGAQTKKSGPVSTRSIRPFTRSETPANQAPDLYDAKSDEFNYFREDLGRQEISSRQKARLEQLASRVVYADPMDKPAADGSEFIDISLGSTIPTSSTPTTKTISSRNLPKRALRAPRRSLCSRA